MLLQDAPLGAVGLGPPVRVAHLRPATPSPWPAQGRYTAPRWAARRRALLSGTLLGAANTTVKWSCSSARQWWEQLTVMESQQDRVSVSQCSFHG